MATLVPGTTGADAPDAPDPADVPAARGGRLPRPARRKQLMAAAQEVFVAQGYHAAAMDDIADRAGVSKPVLYQHFPGKLELYLALLDKHAAALVRAVREAMAATTDNRERVHNAVGAYFDFVEATPRPGAFRLVFESDLRNEPPSGTGSPAPPGCAWRRSPTPSRPTPGCPGRRRSCSPSRVTGTSEMAARWWLGTDRALPKAEAVRLVEALAWRGHLALPAAAGGLTGVSPQGGEARTGVGPARATTLAVPRRRQEDIPVEVKIGVQHTPREMVLESTLSPAEVEDAVRDALKGPASVLTLVDEKGRGSWCPSGWWRTWRSPRPTSAASASRSRLSSGRLGRGGRWRCDRGRRRSVRRPRPSSAGVRR